jgi:hypothetical protein
MTVPRKPKLLSVKELERLWLFLWTSPGFVGHQESELFLVLVSAPAARH